MRPISHSGAKTRAVSITFGAGTSPKLSFVVGHPHGRNAIKKGRAFERNYGGGGKALGRAGAHQVRT
jgi:hypothetical protein